MLKAFLLEDADGSLESRIDSLQPTQNIIQAQAKFHQ